MPDFNNDPIVTITAVSSFFAVIDGSSRPLGDWLSFIYGFETATDSYGARLYGSQVSVSYKSASITGFSSDVSARNSITRGFVTITSAASPALTHGYDGGVSLSPAIIWGKNTVPAVDSFNAVVRGFGVETSDLHTTIYGFATADSAKSAAAWGYDATSQFVRAYTKAYATGTSTSFADVFGYLNFTSSKSAVISGTMYSISSCFSIECGFESAVNSNLAWINGTLYQTEAKGAVIYGYDPQETDINYMPVVLASTRPIGVIDAGTRPIGIVDTKGPLPVGCMRK